MQHSGRQHERSGISSTSVDAHSRSATARVHASLALTPAVMSCPAGPTSSCIANGLGDKELNVSQHPLALALVPVTTLLRQSRNMHASHAALFRAELIHQRQDHRKRPHGAQCCSGALLCSARTAQTAPCGTRGTRQRAGSTSPAATLEPTARSPTASAPWTASATPAPCGRALTACERRQHACMTGGPVAAGMVMPTVT